eukprot:3386160-Rhodomonas_salina.2
MSRTGVDRWIFTLRSSRYSMIGSCSPVCSPLSPPVSHYSSPRSHQPLLSTARCPFSVSECAQRPPV